MSCALRVTIHERDPILLDMGQYWVPSLLSTVQAVAAALRAGNSDQQPGVRRLTGTAVLVGSQRAHADQSSIQEASEQLSAGSHENACVMVAASALKDCCDTAAESVSLHSIVAQPLHARSKIWRNDLNLKDDTQQLIKGYFAAPGARIA